MTSRIVGARWPKFFTRTEVILEGKSTCPLKSLQNIQRNISSLFRTWRLIKSHPLTSRNKAGAMLRLVRWQLGSRILSNPVVMPFVEDSVLVAELGMTGATGNIYCGLHEFEDMAFVLHVLKPADLFVDVGANIGSYTVLAAKTAGANVLALEPVPQTFCRLQRNIRINDVGSRAQALQCAAGGITGTLRFSADRDTLNRVVSESYTGKKIDVPVYPLDNLLEKKPAFIWKIDVEGFEYEVLCGGTQVLQDPILNAVLLEGGSSQINSIMEAAGFVRSSYSPLDRKITVRSSAITKDNYLWIRDVECVKDRCRNARPVVVAGVTV